MNISKLFSILNDKKIVSYYIIIILIGIVTGLLEIIGITSLIPIITILTDPENLNNIKFLDRIYSYLNFDNEKDFFNFFCFFAFLSIILTNLLHILSVWLISFSTFKLNFNLINKLFYNYMNLPYEELLANKSFNLSNKIIVQVKRFVEGVCNSFLFIFQKSLIILIVFSFLLYINYKIALFGFLFGFIFYLIFYFISKDFISRVGKITTSTYKLKQQIVTESLNGYKEIKIYNITEKFIYELKNTLNKLTKLVAHSRTLSILPRYIFEIIFIIIFGSFIFFVIDLKNSNFEKHLPFIVAIFFASYRMLPLLQSIFSHSAEINSNISAFETFKNDLVLHKQFLNSSHPVKFEKKILLKNVSFAYLNSSKNSLNNINFEIKPFDIVGIHGHSGSGKTTLLNIIMGLIKPSSGKILIDDMEINGTNSNWINNIGYVSQYNFIFNDTLVSNITMFEKNPSIERFHQAIELSGLNKFYENIKKNPNYVLNEKGTNLSGGELQRLALARAIYKKPKILILDEFTSALDSGVENEIIENLKQLTTTTKIISSHKLSVLKKCDILIGLYKGNLVTNASENV